MRPYSPGGPLNVFISADNPSENHRPSGHRLGPGLPGYLIPFAPLAFAPQGQSRPSESPSPPAFLLISTHSTAPPRVPLAPACLKPISSPSNSPVEPGDFTRRLMSAYVLFKPSDSEQRLPPSSYRGCWHEVSRGFLWDSSTQGAINSHRLVIPDSGLHPERLLPTRGIAGSSFRSLSNIRYCSLP